MSKSGFHEGNTDCKLFRFAAVRKREGSESGFDRLLSLLKGGSFYGSK